jgi:hypothetical protein
MRPDQADFLRNFYAVSFKNEHPITRLRRDAGAAGGAGRLTGAGLPGARGPRGDLAYESSRRFAT